MSKGKAIAAAVVVGGVLVGGAVWYTLFRVDPEFEAQQQAHEQQQKSLDEAFGD